MIKSYDTLLFIQKNSLDWLKNLFTKQYKQPEHWIPNKQKEQAFAIFVANAFGINSRKSMLLLEFYDVGRMARILKITKKLCAM